MDDEVPLKNDHLVFRPAWNIIICSDCVCGVRLGEVDAHLRKQHHYKRPRRQTVAKWLRECRKAHDGAPDIVPTIPPQLDRPDELLFEWHDGLQCRLDPLHCTYICRNDTNMRTHCRTTHRWTIHSKKGRPGRADRVQDRQDAWTTVSCQQLLPSGLGSHLIRSRGTNIPGIHNGVFEVTRSKADTWWEEQEEAFQASQRAAVQQITETSDKDDSTWLRRTRWTRYLAGCQRDDLMALKASPDPDDDFENVIAVAIQDLIRQGHQKLGQTSNFTRKLLIQVDPHKPRDRPMDEYYSGQSLERAGRHWVTIVLFFVRTYGHEPPDGVHYPPYTLSTVQSGYLAKVRHAADKLCQTTGDHDRRRARLEQVILKFAITLLDDPVVKDEYDCPFVCVLAVLAVRPEGWTAIVDYPTILSSLLRSSRYFVLLYASSKRSVDTPSSSEGPYLQDVKDLVFRFMVRGTHGPIEWMLDLRSYAMKVAFSLTSDAYSHWEGECLTYKEARFDLSQLRAAITTLTYETSQILDRDLLFAADIGDPPPPIPLPSLRDSPHNEDPGFSLVQDWQNQKLGVPTDWLRSQIQGHRRLEPQFYRTHSETGWNLEGVERYLRAVHRFRTYLAVLVHLTAGQPARAPELMTIRVRNGAQGQLRGLYVADGLVDLVTWYHKGSTTYGTTKLIHRHLPARVSLLVVRYVWLVLPWVERIYAGAYRMVEIPTHLWPKDDPYRPFTDTHFRTSFVPTLQRFLGVRITFQDYRHIAATTGRQFLFTHPLWARQSRPDQEDGYDHDQAIEAGDDDRVIYGDDCVEALQQALHHQAAHTTTVAHRVYGRTLAQIAGDTSTQQALYRSASLAWHRLLHLGVSSTTDQPSSGPDGGSNDLEHMVYERWLRLRESDPLAQLRLLYGSTATFRGPQEEIVRAILAGGVPILVIMPTGAGKSLLFQLPASYPFSGTTIVITPLVALQDDLLRRTQALGITSRIWDLDTPDHGVNLIFSTPETAVKPDFIDFVHRLQHTGQLTRIMVDECHLLLTESGGFRPAFLRLRHLVTYEVPVCFLTATLPVHDERTFWQHLSLDNSPTRTFREPTTRPNLEYTVIPLDRDEKDTYLERVIHERTGRTIVYCSTVRDVKRLADTLDTPMYYADLTDKVEQFHTFRTCDHGVIICTNALGLGVHVPDVRLVLHYDPPRTFLDYAQESGRAGRDGKTSRCVLLIERDPSRSSARQDRWMNGYIQEARPSVCRRVLLSGYLDGIVDPGVVGCVPLRDRHPEARLCDVCQPHSTATVPLVSSSLSSSLPPPPPPPPPRVKHPPKRRWRESVDESRGSPVTTTTLVRRPPSPKMDPDRLIYQQQQRQLRAIRQEAQIHVRRDLRRQDEVLEQLVEVGSQCILCLFRRDAVHEYKDCPQDVRERQRQLETLRTQGSRITLANYSGCFTCAFPQAHCARWVPTKAGFARATNGKECAAGRLLYHVASLLMEVAQLTPTVRVAAERVCRELGGDLTCDWILSYSRQKIAWLTWSEINGLFRLSNEVLWAIRPPRPSPTEVERTPP